jgi:hypothetical protein
MRARDLPIARRAMLLKISRGRVAHLPRLVSANPLRRRGDVAWSAGGQNCSIAHRLLRRPSDKIDPHLPYVRLSPATKIDLRSTAIARSRAGSGLTEFTFISRHHKADLFIISI